MKQLNDDLYRLIHNMNKAEKRYFKLFVKGTGGKSDSKAIELFDSIKKVKNPDEHAINKQIEKDVTYSNLSHQKNYLYKLILKSLIAKNADVDNKNEMDYAKPAAKVLVAHGLESAAERYLNKANEKAENNNDWLDLLNMEQMDYIFMTHREELNIEELDEHIQRQERYLKAAHQSTLLKSYLAIFRNMFNYGASDEQWAKYSSKIAELLSTTTPIGYKNELYYQSLTILLHIFQEQEEQAWETLQVLKTKLNEHPECITISGAELKYFLQRNMDNLSPEEFKRERQTIEDIANAALESKIVSLQWLTEFRATNHELDIWYLFTNGSYEEVEEAIDRYKILLQEYGHLLVNLCKAHIGLHICIVQLCYQKLNKALDELNEVFEYGVNSVNHQLYKFSHVIQFMIHYELDNRTLLENMLRSYKRNLTRYGLFQDADRVIVQNFTQLLKPYKENNALISHFVKELRSFQKEHMHVQALQLCLENKITFQDRVG